MHRETVIAAVYEQREATLRRVATLADSQWDRPCPVARPPHGVVRLDVPQRTVRDLVAHLILVDEIALRGGTARNWAGLRRVEGSTTWDRRRIGPLMELSITELVTLLARRGERFAQLAAAAPAAAGHLPVRGPFGRQPLLQLFARRVLHEWLHERDIAVSQGKGSTALPVLPVAKVLADAVLSRLPATVLPVVPLDRGVVRLVIDVAAPGGAMPRVWGVDFARHQYGPRVTAPADVTVHVSAAALALLAHGRGTWDDPDLDVRIDGELGLATAVLESLAAPVDAGATAVA